MEVLDSNQVFIADYRDLNLRNNYPIPSFANFPEEGKNPPWRHNGYH